MRLLQLAFVVALASGLAAILIYITGVSNFGRHIFVYMNFYLFFSMYLVFFFPRHFGLLTFICGRRIYNAFALFADVSAQISSEDLEALRSLGNHFQKCVVRSFLILQQQEIYIFFCVD